ncbi:MAG TPA: PilC/PilY family type IV pilus protein [Nevskiaceae bacterium]
MHKIWDVTSNAGPRRLISGFIGLACAALVLGAAHAAMPMDTTIDQVPLTASRSVAPNILLMMDDSGSMAWDYMPDYSNVTSHGGGLYDARYNGVYYNPNEAYTPPPTVNGGTYPNSPGLTQAYWDGFRDQSLQNVIREGNQVGQWFWYGTWLKIADRPSQPVNWSCRAGYQQVPGDPTKCVPVASPQTQIPWIWVCPGGWSGPDSTSPTPQCRYTDSSSGEKPVSYVQNATHGCTSNYSYDATNDVCNAQLQVGANASCPKGGSASSTAGTPETIWYNRQNGWNGVDTCWYGDYVAVFQYYGPSGWRFVAKKGECANVMDSGQKAACRDESTVGDGTNGAPQGVNLGQNVANWFSYYRTRMLTAKTGLMKALAGMQPDTRFGFGSINGRGAGNIPSPVYTYDDTAIAQPGNKIAAVQTFGDGTSGTQRANFWKWLTNLTPGGETPLREALNQAGKYYQTAQPWQSNDGTSNSTDELACRQSYTILTTDGFWNGPDQSGDVGGNVDNTKGPTIKGPNQPDYTYNPAPPFSDGYAGTLADVAQYYWENDLQPSLPNEVPPGLEDPAFWQHMGLFTLGMGFQPSGLQGTVTDASGNTRAVTVPDIFKWVSDGSPVTGFQWPQPSTDPNGQGNINNIADLVHAAVNGHGGYYSALDPNGFTAGILGALQRIQQRAGTGASFASNGAVLQLGSTTYQTMYSTGKWNGDLRAYPVNPTTGQMPNAPSVQPTTPWSAAAQMPDWDSSQRKVFTYNPSADSDSQFFQIAASNASDLTTTLGKLSADEKAALASRITAPSATPDQTAIDSEAGNMLQYLLGDHALETANTGGVYRTREGVLGDIVNSTPVYVGAPDAGAHPNDTDYMAFVNATKGRTAVVWVAANDGMLHAFDASSGVEKFAYLPGSVITANVEGAAWRGLANYADPNYGGSNPHEYFNDGRITVADAEVAAPNETTGQDPAWRTVLVATTGRGPARAVYALDITDPGNAKLMWERSAGDSKPGSDYIGQNISTPVIAHTASGWQVFMGNGYNSDTDQGALLQFSLADGDLSVYTTDSETGNGMAPPVIWIGDASGGDGSTAYAGDLLGRVWSFDLTKPGTAGTKLFTATDDGGKAQPITAGMLAGRGPGSTAFNGAVWVFFGTGKYLTRSDLSNVDTQTWYGLIVQPAQGQTAAVVNNLSSGRNALVQRFINPIAGDAAAQPPRPQTRVITDGGNLLADKSGWYIDLQPNGDSVPHGERIVVANQFQSGWLLATTQLPEYTNLCNPSGTGWVMAINPFTGANPGSIFFDLDGDDRFTSNDKVTLNGKSYAAAGVHFDAIPNAPVFVGSRMLNTLDNAARSNINTAGPTTFGMVSWRELVTNN